ncbi:MAG: hypothetical protein LC768_02345 [Acidobacteria bacterium]|nr:hypothetical protein [Acidobacteriota bacterium]MCA1637172.1 hypothetical protein [Acidobacteriota bacterium]
MSKINFTSVPFTIDENFSRFAGVGKFSSAGIVLEFEGRIFGVIKNGVKEVRFTLDDILDVKFRKGFLKRGARIEIRLKSFTKLNEMPNRDGKIALKIERDDFERAAKAVLKLQKDLSEYQEVEPSTHTPVSRLFSDNDFEMKDLEK